MTRLNSNDIEAIPSSLVDYDHYLRSVTGQSLLEIGMAASGMEDGSIIERAAPTVAMAVVPIRSGRGIVSGFTQTVCRILIHLGFDARVTGNTDVAGFADAFETGARVILAADDDRFVAFCPKQGKIVDNSRATANGFVAGLEFMAGGLVGKKVLVLGCGPVGRFAVQALLTRNAKICVLDRETRKAAELAAWARDMCLAHVLVLSDAEQALLTHDLIVDATNAAEVIDARHVTPRTRISAPGMPCGITAKALEKLNRRILHDPLQIGVATMACEAMRIILEDRPSGSKGVFA
jgi:pyrrolysine biosynthesis protein PylD